MYQLKEKFSFSVLIGLLFFTIGFLLRYYFAVKFLDLGFFTKYPSFAQQLLTKTFEERVLDFSPNFLLLWLFLEILFPLDWRIYALLAHSILGGINALLIFLIALEISGRRGAVLAGILYSFSLTLIAYDISFEPEVMVILFNLAFLYSFFNLRNESKPNWALMGTGLFAGLSYSTRPNFSIFLLLFLVLFLFRGTRKKLISSFPSETMKRRFLKSGIAVSGFLIGILPSLLLNLTYAHQWKISYMSPGQVFHQGNNPFATGLEPGYVPLVKNMQDPQIPDHAHILYRRVSEDALGKKMGFDESELFWIIQGAKYLKESPREAIFLWLRKIFYFFNCYESHDVAFIQEKAQRLGSYPLIPTRVIFFIGWVGIIHTLIRRESKSLVLYILFVAYLASCIFLFAGSRQRLPVIPIYILFSSLPLAREVDFSQKKEGKEIMVSGLVAVVILFLITRTDTTILIRERGVQGKSDYLTSSTLFGRGDYERGMELLISAVQKNPQDSHEYLSIVSKTTDVYHRAIEKMRKEYLENPSLLNRIILGCLLTEAGQYSEAMRIFEEIRLKSPSYFVPLPYYNIFYQEGKILVKTGQWEQAVKILKEGIRMNFPVLHRIELNYLLSLALIRGEEKEQAQFFLDKGENLALSVLNIPEQWNLTYAYLSVECGFLKDATCRYKRIIDKWPDFHSARVSYANILLTMGDREEAYKQFLYLAQHSKRFQRYAKKRIGELESQRKE